MEERVKKKGLRFILAFSFIAVALFTDLKEAEAQSGSDQILFVAQ